MRTSMISNCWDAAQLAALMNDNKHLSKWRSAQLQRFLSQGFPNRQVESWKYTNVSSIANQNFSLMTESQEQTHPIKLLPNAYAVVFVNGRWIRDLSNLPKEVKFQELMNDNSSRMQNSLMIDEAYHTPFLFLNDALFSKGCVLRIPAGMQVDQPIHLVHLTEGKDTVSAMSHVRQLFIIGENASATIFEEYIGANGLVYFNNVVNQIHVEKNARLYFYKLQREGREAFHIANTVIHQVSDSHVETGYFTNGAKLGREDLNYNLAGSGAFAKLLGYYHANKGSLLDHHIRVDHRVPHCVSDQCYKGIIDENSIAVFNGKIIVHPNAQKTIANQSNKNLLLAKTAEINAKPELEIYADDVKCSHGATVGQLDDAALFYLRSRGIQESEARHLLSVAFVSDVLDQITDKRVAAEIKTHVMRQLEGVL